jgi:hypothetical protein
MVRNSLDMWDVIVHCSLVSRQRYSLSAPGFLWCGSAYNEERRDGYLTCLGGYHKNGENI